MALTSLPLATRREATSMVALAHCWPGPTESVMARRVAGWESEKIVYLRPDCCFASKIFRAWYMTASNTSLLSPRWKRLLDQPSQVRQAHAAPTLPLSSRDPSVQMVPPTLQFRAVSSSGPSLSMQ